MGGQGADEARDGLLATRSGKMRALGTLDLMQVTMRVSVAAGLGCSGLSSTDLFFFVSLGQMFPAFVDSYIGAHGAEDAEHDINIVAALVAT